MPYWINKCVCSIQECFNLLTAAEVELTHIQSKEGLRLKHHNKNEFPEMTPASLKMKNLFIFMTSLFSGTNVFSHFFSCHTVDQFVSLILHMYLRLASLC